MTSITNITTAAKTSQKKGFNNESCNGFARVINLCPFPSQPMQIKQVHHGGIIFIRRFRHEFSCSQYLSTYKQKGSKVFLLSNARHPCMRCPIRCDGGQKNQLALSRKLGISINSVKEDNIVRYTQIFEDFFLEISVPFVPVSKILKFLVEW